MSLIRKVFRRIQDGTLRSTVLETRWIYRHTRAYWRAVVLYTVLGLCATGLSMGIALVSKSLTNAIIGRHGHAVLRLGICVVTLGLVNILLSAFIGRFSAKINYRISNELRAEVFGVFLNTEWQSLQEYRSGDLLSRINTDVTTVAASVLGWIPSLILKLAQFVASLVIILCYDPTMALLALVTAPLTLLVAKPFMGKMRHYSREMRDVNSQMISFHEEALQNAQSIKAFNLVGTFLERLHRVQELYYNTSMDFNRFTVLNSSLLSACGLIVSYLCLGWGAYRLYLGAIDYGTMVLFMQLAGYLSAALTALIKLAPSAIECTVAAQRIMTIFELPRERDADGADVQAMLTSGEPVSVQLEGLAFGYPNRSATLHDVSLTVPAYSMVAIVGASGAGKTTLFRLMLGLLRPSGGSASVATQAQTLPLSPSTRRLFSYVPQDNVIFSGTVAETLRLVKPDATDEQLWDALRTACAEDFVRALPQGLETRLRERGGSLSEGQNQRLSIARAILADAPILLLDEVTSALDLDTERQVLRNISALHQKTCILSTHRPSVLALCDRVYRIRGGRLEPLPPDELARMCAGM